MEQVTAKQRIKVAAKDHILISRLHLRLHPAHVAYAVTILLTLAIAIFIVVGIMRPNVKSEWEVTALQASTDDRYSA